MPEVLVRNPADQALISQIHADAVTLITAEEVAQQHAPWFSLTGSCPETLMRRHELERWYEQLKGDIGLFLELRDEIETMSPDDIYRIEGSGQRMIAALWKLIG